MLARARPAMAGETEPLVAMTTMAVRVIVIKPRLSIRHMNHRCAKRKRASAAIDLLR